MNKIIIKEAIGIVLFALGLGAADSEWVLVPLALMSIGALLLRDTFKKAGNTDGQNED